jgi:hypothetical protein
LRAFVVAELKAEPQLTLGDLTWRANVWNRQFGRRRPITGTAWVSERSVRNAAKGTKSF